MLIRLFIIFFKIGAFTFGGGYAMLPMINESVLKNGWMSPKELIDFVAVSQSTPGPFGINISTYDGYETAGIEGAAMATLGVVLPSFLIILIIAKLFDSFMDNRYVKSVMNGLRPAVVGLIAAAFVSVFYTVFFGDGFSFKMLKSAEYMSEFTNNALIFITAFVCIKLKVHPITIIILSAIMGIVSGVLIG